MRTPCLPRILVLGLVKCSNVKCFSLFLDCWTSSRETGALNRIIDRGSRAINFILSSMVFNIVPTILEVWLSGLHCLHYCPRCFYFGSSGSMLLSCSHFCPTCSSVKEFLTSLTYTFLDIYGIRYIGLQIWSSLCMDNFLVSGCICCFYTDCYSGGVSLPFCAWFD